MKKQWKSPEIKVIVSSSPQESVLGNVQIYVRWSVTIVPSSINSISSKLIINLK